MDKPKNPYHEMVAEKLVSQIEAGTAPWQRPWNPGEAAGVLPVNPSTGNRYRGINSLWLMASGHEDNRWMTYKQAQSLGAQVRKGEKGTQVQYWKMTEEQSRLDGKGEPVLDRNGKPEKVTVHLERPKVFLATVFNAEQVDGLPPPEQAEKSVTERQWKPAERAEAIIHTSEAKVIHREQDAAYYRPSSDTIYLPNQAQFDSAEKYYATALHELGHWTGHESRLNRDLKHPFGSEGYAREELRAEIASMMLGNEMGIGHDPGQHAAYAKSWVKVLKRDSLEIFRAAADAEKICSHVLSFEKKLEQKAVKEQTQEPAHSPQQETVTASAVPFSVKTHQASALQQKKEADEQLAQAMAKGDWTTADRLGKAHLGFRLTPDWNGRSEVRGCVKEDDNAVRSQLHPGEKPDFYGLYLNRQDGRQLWVADYDKAPDAIRMNTRLHRIYQRQQEIQKSAQRAASPQKPSPSQEAKTPSAKKSTKQKEKELQR